jgi:hypothetical protein
MFGMNFGYLFVSLFNLLLLAGWIVLVVLALVQLRHRQMADTARGIWAGLIVIVPLGGALAFWIVRPGKSEES